MNSHLSLPRCSDDVIETLVLIACGEAGSARAKHIYRESLRNLVRLAKVEHTQEEQMGLRRLPDGYAEGVLH